MAANLALFGWIFVILKIAPMTRSLFVGTIFLALASVYSLGCGYILADTTPTC